MPVITPSYLYTFFATLAVGSILAFAFMNYAESIKISAEIKELRDLLNNVAAKVTELVNMVEEKDAVIEVSIQAPASIGGKKYWLRLMNESKKVWIEGYFGGSPFNNTYLKVYTPTDAIASGQYFGGYGAIILECKRINGQIVVTISGSGG